MRAFHFPWFSHGFVVPGMADNIHLLQFLQKLRTRSAAAKFPISNRPLIETAKLQGVGNLTRPAHVPR